MLPRSSATEGDHACLSLYVMFKVGLTILESKIGGAILKKEGHYMAKASSNDGGESYSGHCLCGAVHYRVTGPLEDPHICHCGMCRRQSGHFVAAAAAKRADFAMTGEDHLSWFDSSDFARRGFCRHCGSILFWDDGSEWVGINMGSLDQPTKLRLERHIFVEDKADYYDIDDDLPRFRGLDQPVT